MTIRMALVAVGIALLSHAAAAQSGKPKSWKCSAPGLQAGEYSGGNTAYIRLVGYSSGGHYSVTRKGDDVATGTTANGTKFTCRLS